MTPLTITTCQADNTFGLTQRLANYLAVRLHIPCICVEDVPWPERYRLIDSGDITIGWICGLPYVKQADRPEPGIDLLATPVMAGERYGARPCYFSDVVVRHDSGWQRFSDLHGASRAVNEPGSHSGYNIVRYTLAAMGADGRFFSRVIMSGSHLNSLAMILRGEVDASAIDSTVLEWAFQLRPSLRTQLRIIDTLGPSPGPPLVIQRHLPPDLKAHIHRLLCQMHEEKLGQLILKYGEVARFTAVTDQDYDPIRQMAQRAAAIQFPT
ncbi:MAG TPA: PhnD/SsuA/transferrin family substrate-binding protein [Chloroflexota bacterium]|nr:PhnD/SsuA/transferrin family substrate-binding protein [Chloroflexota bacterium]